MKEKEKYTKFEVTRIIGARALQIAMDAPILIDISKEKLEEIKYDPIKIADIEFNSGILPISVKRPMPKKTEDKIKPITEEKPKEVPEKDKKTIHLEKAEESEIKEEGEIMELARPADEVEETAEKEEEAAE